MYASVRVYEQGELADYLVRTQRRSTRRHRRNRRLQGVPPNQDRRGNSLGQRLRQRERSRRVEHGSSRLAQRQLTGLRAVPPTRLRGRSRHRQLARRQRPCPTVPRHGQGLAPCRRLTGEESGRGPSRGPSPCPDSADQARRACSGAVRHRKRRRSGSS